MTRTARASYPRAVNRDRSESKSGLDTSLRKGGAGRHNWGGIANERDLEAAAMRDEEFDEEEEEVVESSTGSVTTEDKKPDMSRSASTISEEEVQSAKKFRKNALKSKDIDLAAIARTSSALSTSPTTSRVEVATPLSV